MAPIQSVLLVFAMEAEATPFIKVLDLKKDEPAKIAGPAPCVTYTGSHGDLKVHVVWNGKCAINDVCNVGTVPAALASYLAILAIQPDLVISTGTAGGFKAQDAHIGDIFLSTSVINHDRRIPIPGFDMYGMGHRTSPSCPNLQAACGFKKGVVSSGNSLDFTDKCMAIMIEHKVAVKEMEAAAIAWVCELFGKPLICVKSITDIVDGGRPSQDEFLENLHAAAVALQGALPKVLDFVAGKEMGEL
ncbi:hypothetical protein FOA52_005253 [Chlamydomonas sp. UWO 241]|nr:hypothetical protein FOA52_005253 [Chlamydomonas sp. UWO 241]